MYSSLGRGIDLKHFKIHLKHPEGPLFVLKHPVSTVIVDVVPHLFITIMINMIHYTAGSIPGLSQLPALPDNTELVFQSED